MYNNNLLSSRVKNDNLFPPQLGINVSKDILMINLVKFQPHVRPWLSFVNPFTCLKLGRRVLTLKPTPTQGFERWPWHALTSALCRVRLRGRVRSQVGILINIKRDNGLVSVLIHISDLRSRIDERKKAFLERRILLRVHTLIINRSETLTFYLSHYRVYSNKFANKKCVDEKKKTRRKNFSDFIS